MTCRSVSGSSRSPSCVESTRSANRMVTTLRVSPARSSLSSVAPQALQKRPSGGFSRPHATQIVTKRAYGGLNADARAGRIGEYRLEPDPGPPYIWAVSVCPNCGHENEPAAKFCSECGIALMETTRAARAERKILTVLFADLVGFTGRAGQLDPEDVQAVLAPYHERLRYELERWGGTVEKFIGDAVMALFGAPIAREDDPERAVRAALAIRDWIVEEGKLHVRIGVNTGEALVNLAARPEAGEGMAAGDVVNTAARLQAAAATNGILVGETTRRATAQTIDYREADAVQAKGKEEPIPVWEVGQARARFGVDLAPETRTPLIGRARELDQLVDALARVREQWSPELVTLVGVPGIGKTLLVGELFRSIERGGVLTYW